MPSDTGPLTTTTSVNVIVTPVQTASDPNGLRTFDITFTDSYATDLPLLVVPAEGGRAQTGAALTGTTVVDQEAVEPRVPREPRGARQRLRRLQPDKAVTVRPWPWTPTAVS